MGETNELRRQLDKLGVHWREGVDDRNTLWESNGLTWMYFNNENNDARLGFLSACENDITPEQAIAATIGGNDYKQAAAYWKRMFEELLAAIPRSGECELAYGENDDGVDCWCTHCGGWFAATRKDGRMIRPLFCQMCGGKAVEQ